MPNPSPRSVEPVLVIVAPGLLALPDEALVRIPWLARLAALASDPTIESAGIDAALAAAVGYRGAIAPLTALGAGIDAAGDFTTHAEPVHVEIGATDAVVRGRVDDLDENEARTLAADLNASLGIEGVRIAVARPDRWFALSQKEFAGEALAVDAIVGQSLIERLRRDDATRRSARLGSEIEMLLHEHPINRARSARGAATVDRLWFWGGGCLAPPGDRFPTITASAGPGRVGDLARGLAVVAQGRPVAASSRDAAATVEPSRRALDLEPQHIAVTVADPVSAESGIELLDRGEVAAALAALGSRGVAQWVLVADGDGRAVTWRARPPRFAQRLRMRLRKPQFSRP